MIDGETLDEHAAAGTTARGGAVAALIAAAESWPEIAPPEVGAGVGGEELDERDRALATAIYRTAAQRWITLEYLLDQHLTQRMGKLEPVMRAILLAGAAQLVFMDKLPGYAVVNESVELAKRLLRPGAGGMVNAVLRKMVGLKWREKMPGREPLGKYLSVATSHPMQLIESWIARWGAEQAEKLAAHSNVHPPTIVRCDDPPTLAEGVDYELHDEAGFVVWKSDHAKLAAFLSEVENRWVQDPTASSAMEATRELKPRPGMIVDYCAGKGTKTKQLAAVHPAATIIATDVDAGRYADLERAFKGHGRVRVTPMGKMGAYAGKADLLVLDVPCSNTGVLARRPEARYRYSTKSIDSVLGLQRSIIRASQPLLAEGGTLLYSTCSIEERENQVQAKWIEKHLRMTRVGEGERLPAGEGRAYHDGGYWSIFR